VIEIGTISLTSVAIALIAVWLNHVLANTRDKVKERHTAGKKVVEAFRPELDALSQTDQDCRLILTESAYLRHESAVRNHLSFLSWLDRLRIQYAWRKLAYHQRDKKHLIPFYEQYADCGSLAKRHNVRPVVIERISRIIAIAQE
jgi:hypothetical protein